MLGQLLRERARDAHTLLKGFKCQEENFEKKGKKVTEIPNVLMT